MTESGDQGFLRIDWTLLLIPLIGLVAVWPFLTQSLPSTDDGALHLLRLVEVDRCLRHGVSPLRWAPDFAHGYGYPGFNYYMNLPTFIAELWHLIGLDFPQAIAGAMVTAFFVSGWGAYLLGRDLAGKKAGLIVATAYMYAPYQFYDSAYRGNLPETWALAWLPWVLWTARRAAMRRRWRDIVPFVLVYAALIWTHNVYSLIGSSILGVYLLLLWWTQGHTWRDARRLAAMVGLGIALAAFFWLPAFFEQGWTRYSPGLFDHEAHFLEIGELLSWPPQVDLSRLNYYPPRSLNWGMLILTVLGTAFYLLDKLYARTHRFRNLAHHRLLEWAFFLLVLLCTSFMPLYASRFLWRTIRPLQVIQMPWRFLGIASLAGSLCAGTAIGRLFGRPALESLALPITGIAIVLVVAFAIPWTYAAPFPQPQNPGVADILRWEYGTGLIGGTSTSEFLPIWARLPEEPADPALLSEHDPLIARLDRASLPEGARVVSGDYDLVRADLVIDTPRAFRAVYKQFYFPGWRVEIDGQKVPLIATAPYGLLGFDVPAGEHRIVVRPTPTPLRAVGSAITAVAALVTVGVLVRDRPLPGVRPPFVRLHTLTPGEVRNVLLIAGLGILMLVVKEGVIDRTDNLFRAHRFDGERVPGLHTETQINFGDVLTLHGYDLPKRPVVSGEPLRVDLYLSARQPVDGMYTAYARLTDDEGRLWSLPNNGRPGGFREPPPTALWPADAYGHWAYLSYTLPGAPPGEYWIEIALFERDTWRGLNVLDAQGRIVGLTARIGPIQIARPRTPPSLDVLAIEQPAAEAPVTGLSYLGSTQDLHTARAGETLNITLFWKAAQAIERNYSLRLTLAAEGETFILAEGMPLGRHTHPTTAWVKGEIVRSPHRLHIPATVGAGVYAIEGTVLDAQEAPAAASISLGTIEVKPTDRVFVVPPNIQHRTDVDFENQTTLLGYDLPETQVAPDSPLPVTLYWQAKREMNASYKVFVQLVGTDGVLAQADAVPVHWTRPTTGWVSGEVIVDAYTLSIPADAPQGNYSLVVGLYEGKSLQRLTVLDASGNSVGDHIVLQEVAVK